MVWRKRGVGDVVVGNDVVDLVVLYSLWLVSVGVDDPAIVHLSHRCHFMVYLHSAVRLMQFVYVLFLTAQSR